MDGGAGPLSSRLTTWTWRGVRAVAGRHDHGAPSLFGPIVHVGIVLTWVVLLWAGWVFVFAMGNGDVTPNGDAWRLVASVTNASGMLLVTLVITSVLSVIGAVVQKRAFASLVTNLGMNEEAVLKDVRGGGDLRTLDLPRDGIAPQPSLLSAQYEAYPVQHVYRPAQSETSPIVAPVVLDETPTVLRCGVPEGARPNRAVLRSARSMVTSVLDTMPSAFIPPAPDTPPPPRLGALRAHGVPVVTDAAFEEALQADGWTWSEWSS